MRIWSLHPKYLDAKGLVALWREGLLARKVLLGETKGYQHHPQLIRFRAQPDPVMAIDSYLLAVYEDARRREYNFNRSKIGAQPTPVKITVTQGQLQYESEHLKAKLRHRAPQLYAQIAAIPVFAPHPIFQVVPGEVAQWEKQ